MLKFNHLSQRQPPLALFCFCLFDPFFFREFDNDGRLT